MTFKNSENALDCYKFYQLDMRYYDEANTEYIVPAKEDSKAYADLKYLEVNAPTEEGTYRYHFKFSYYNKGEVSYGLKVVVSTEPNYDIIDLVKYRNTRLTDSETINQILNLLPYSKYKTGIIIKTSLDPKELVVNYSEFIINRKDLTNNIIALFTLIPELDLIVYQSAEENYTFTRYEIEKQVGRKLEEYSNDVELWKKEVLFKEKVMDETVSRDEFYKAIITDIISEFGIEKFEEIAIDTKSFKDAAELKLSDIDRQEVLEYVSNFADIVYDITYQDYKALKSNELWIGLSDIKDKITYETIAQSGDTLNENETSGEVLDFSEMKGKYIATIMVLQNNKESIYRYEVKFENEKWNIVEL